MNGFKSIRKKRILVVPLNWGLGHATRLIPVIKQLIALEVEVITGGSPQHQQLLKQEITHLETVDFPYLNIHLSGRKTQLFSLAFQLPTFLFQIVREHYALKKLIRSKNIDVVISDNCYGLWNRSVYSVFITHQLQIRLPQGIRFLERSVNRINSYFIHKFNECWVPDWEEEGGFAGELSHTVPFDTRVKYIGILSRFTCMKQYTQSAHIKFNKKILFIISGPEKQRTVFENIIREELTHIPKKYDYMVIRGLPSEKEPDSDQWLSHAGSGKMHRLMVDADVIVCRAGYSTIMDLLALGKTAILIPTPGQTEQEYLAGYLATKGYFHTYQQHQFKLSSAISYFEKLDINNPPVPCDKTNFRTFLEKLPINSTKK